MTVEVTGAAVPRFSRRDVALFAQRVMRVARAKDDLSIAFVDDVTMRDLNRRFRHKDKTTDVLTFESEIVISVDQARRQAAFERHSLATEVRYLIVHGVLHSMGYDHETDDGEMNALELKVRAKLGLP